MCLTGCNGPSPPNSSMPATTVVGTCGSDASEIVVIDEIGLPFANQPVRLTAPDGKAVDTTTLVDGRICLNLPPGSTVQVQLVDTHEGHAGDSTTTASGRHFSAGGTGP